MDPGLEGEVREEGENGGGKGNGDVGNTKEGKGMRYFVSFSSEKGAEEPWPPSLLTLGGFMMDPDPEQLYKQLNINMTIINSLPFFITALTSAA